MKWALTATAVVLTWAWACTFITLRSAVQSLLTVGRAEGAPAELPMPRNAKLPSCSVDADCPGEQQCDRGECRTMETAAPSGTGCIARSDCPSNEECVEGLCAPPPNVASQPKGTACRDNSDCAGGQSCLDGACQFPNGVPTASKCENDQDCVVGLVCQSGACRLPPPR
jgi:hypothetical protein